MDNAALFWFFCNFLSIVVLSFFSMFEMACVSFNKVRLQYYAAKGIKQAVWLNTFLQNPARLFGTTLIGVNVALFTGSEFSRLFYSSIGLDPDLAPLTQVILVVIFGELAPMFAARRYAEHVAMLSVPLVYLSAKLMTPFLWLVGGISHLCNRFIGGKETEANLLLTQEELLKILEEQDEDKTYAQGDKDFNTIATNIFNLRSKNVWEIMDPIANFPSLPANATVGEVHDLMSKSFGSFVLIYKNSYNNIVAVVTPRELLRAPDNRKARDYGDSPWFVTQETTVIQILKQFRNNNQRLAVILDNEGLAVGVVHMEDIMAEIFGKSTLTTNQRLGKLKNQLLIERTFPASMRVGEFNRKYGALLYDDTELTLAQLMEKYLGHLPTQGESVQLGPFELVVKEASLLEVKSINISTRV